MHPVVSPSFEAEIFKEKAGVYPLISLNQNNISSFGQLVLCFSKYFEELNSFIYPEQQMHSTLRDKWDEWVVYWIFNDVSLVETSESSFEDYRKTWK